MATSHWGPVDMQILTIDKLLVGASLRVWHGGVCVLPHRRFRCWCRRVAVVFNRSVTPAGAGAGRAAGIGVAGMTATGTAAGAAVAGAAAAAETGGTAGEQAHRMRARAIAAQQHASATAAVHTC